MRIAFFDSKDYDIQSFAKFESRSDLEFKFFDTKLNEDTAHLASGFDAVCCFVNDDVNARTVNILYKLGIKLILLRCAGYNNVDVKECFGKIRVMRVPAYSPYAIAEHAMALLLTSIRRIHKAYNRTREFNFNISGLTGFDLHGKTVGVIGTGKIGRIFIDICKGFGMNVIAYDKFPIKDSGIKYVELEEIYRKSDIISFHCPLTNETQHMFGEKALGMVKKGVVIINTSRGPLIDSKVLLEGLLERKIGAACLDVYEEEGDIFFTDYSNHIVNDDVLARLISLPNVIVTSHQAFLTKEALENIADVTIENVDNFINKVVTTNEVCYQCPKQEKCDRSNLGNCFVQK